MNKKWEISVNKELLCTMQSDGSERYIFIGFNNGQKVRKDELYFSQREKDTNNYNIFFNPEPYFISYSFFYGLFNETIGKMCLEFEKDRYLLTKKSIILKKFFEKFNFVIEQNKELQTTLREYAAAIIEKIFDIQVGIGNYGNS